MCGFSDGMQFDVPGDAGAEHRFEHTSQESRSEHIALSQSADRVTVELRGEIDISIAAQLKTVLLEALAARRSVSIAIEEATVLDVTAFQLIWSAKRDAIRTGLNFSIRGALSDPIRTALQQMALDEHFVKYLEGSMGHLE
jgi:anti-anti-sigma regulatory factor